MVVRPSPLSPNYDPDVFPDPLRFDIHRKPKRILSFGAGPHHCIGNILGRAAITTAITRLLARFPKAHMIDPNFTPVYGGAVGELRLQSLPMRTHSNARSSCRVRSLAKREPGMTVERLRCLIGSSIKKSLSEEASMNVRMLRWLSRSPCFSRRFGRRPRRRIRTRPSASSCPTRRAGCRTRWRASSRQHLQERIGQSVVVENRAGGGAGAPR